MRVSATSLDEEDARLQENQHRHLICAVLEDGNRSNGRTAGRRALVKLEHLGWESLGGASHEASGAERRHADGQCHRSLPSKNAHKNLLCRSLSMKQISCQLENFIYIN